MNKSFKEYLSILGILILINAMNFYANSATIDKSSDCIEAIADGQSFSDGQIQSDIFNASNKENKSKFLIEITEIENEELSNEENPLSLNSISTNFINAQLFNELSFQLDKVLKQHTNYYDKSSTKLHVRLQVFII